MLLALLPAISRSGSGLSPWARTLYAARHPDNASQEKSAEMRRVFVTPAVSIGRSSSLATWTSCTAGRRLRALSELYRRLLHCALSFSSGGASTLVVHAFPRSSQEPQLNCTVVKVAMQNSSCVVSGFPLRSPCTQTPSSHCSWQNWFWGPLWLLFVRLQKADLLPKKKFYLEIFPGVS